MRLPGSCSFLFLVSSFFGFALLLWRFLWRPEFARRRALLFQVLTAQTNPQGGRLHPSCGLMSPPVVGQLNALLYCGSRPAFTAPEDAATALLGALKRGKDSVVDVGGGDGAFACLAQRMGIRALAIDRSRAFRSRLACTFSIVHSGFFKGSHKFFDPKSLLPDYMTAEIGPRHATRELRRPTHTTEYRHPSLRTCAPVSLSHVSWEMCSEKNSKCKAAPESLAPQSTLQRPALLPVRQVNWVIRTSNEPAGANRSDIAVAPERSDRGLPRPFRGSDHGETCCESHFGLCFAFPTQFACENAVAAGVECRAPPKASLSLPLHSLFEELYWDLGQGDRGFGMLKIDVGGGEGGEQESGILNGFRGYMHQTRRRGDLVKRPLYIILVFSPLDTASRHSETAREKRVSNVVDCLRQLERWGYELFDLLVSSDSAEGGGDVPPREFREWCVSLLSLGETAVVVGVRQEKLLLRDGSGPGMEEVLWPWLTRWTY
uniref:Methyltransferase domain-containing protein n=1 Tax=Chromera velia CCMP2878 TaxID=1169474 RepID=A0A0G4FHR3_9ALVE|eukprot:Cvel_16923.t1-p1 / transcript=Cvel_16923.t1 / gene=Cvel_16923 / organism=Chromera_velia_CCMP2878 / gene_product=hypothetical protein / transcript_product=hypothetical protein / location=Cvel_scaffold1326:6775-8238(-) / protein_length=488 / sequence_SO=supercontig / SO=protein_coding / is_pseudo=false